MVDTTSPGPGHIPSKVEQAFPHLTGVCNSTYIALLNYGGHKPCMIMLPPLPGKILLCSVTGGSAVELVRCSDEARTNGSCHEASNSSSNGAHAGPSSLCIGIVLSGGQAPGQILPLLQGLSIEL